jgi:hypothetical protein
MDDNQQSNERIAADLLLGAEQIRDFLNSLGFDVNIDAVYYARKVKRWPINRHGKALIASKSRLMNHAKKMLAA